MKRSTDAILTTHVGRLQRPDTITEKLVGRYAGKAVDQAALDAELKASVAEVVRQQADAGIRGRERRRVRPYQLADLRPRTALGLRAASGRIEVRHRHPQRQGSGGVRRLLLRVRHARRPHLLQVARRGRIERGMRDHQPVCVGPVAYRGQAMLRAEIDALKSALGKADAAEAFMTSTAPGDIVYAAPNDYYRNEEDYLYAVADAMKAEYHAIVDAGLVLQIDDPMIPAYWDLMLTQGVDIPKYHRYCETASRRSITLLPTSRGTAFGITSAGEPSRPSRLGHPDQGCHSDAVQGAGERAAVRGGELPS